ncbi:MAG: hypothetical protein RRY36_01725 [Bacteroidaceae bacterium]
MEKKMIHRLAILILISTSFIACADNSYKGYVEPNELIEDPTPVMLTVGDPSFSVETKGSGAIDGSKDDAWNGSLIYIYSFVKDMNSVSYDITSANNLDICLIDGSIDKPGTPLGKEAKIPEIKTLPIMWTGAEQAVFYRPNNIPYDFFAYYIDEMNIQEMDVLRAPDHIQMNVTIDGTQDLMSAHAQLTKSQIDEIDTSPVFTETEKFNIKNNSYSAYTARRNFQPIMIFRHHLVRLVFKLFAGGVGANDAIVDSIIIKSKVKGVFTVASAKGEKMGLDFSGSNEYKELYLKEKNAKGEMVDLTQDKSHTSYTGDFSEPLYERNGAMVVGESMLVASDTEYKCLIKMKQYIEKLGRWKYFTAEADLKAVDAKGEPAPFLPGQQYTVRVAIYGVQKVEIETPLEPWGQGGNVELDPNDDFFKK